MLPLSSPVTQKSLPLRQQGGSNPLNAPRGDEETGERRGHRCLLPSLTHVSFMHLSLRSLLGGAETRGRDLSRVREAGRHVCTMKSTFYVLQNLSMFSACSISSVFTRAASVPLNILVSDWPSVHIVPVNNFYTFLSQVTTTTVLLHGTSV